MAPGEPNRSTSSTLAYGLVRERLGLVEREIERACQHSEIALVRQISRYLHRSGGKRLRPAMVLLCARACGYRGDDDVELGVIVEFIHTATLVHDDIVDDATVRRGQTAANVVWGNQLAVLLGDYVYIRSMAMSVGLGDLRLVQVLTDATSRLLEGEILDVIHAGDRDLDTDAYLDIIHRKTASLFAACGRSAAVLAGASGEIEEGLHEYGAGLGMAFQLIDDLLDYSADADVLGKKTGADLREGKMTLPTIHLLREGSPEARELVLSCLGDEERATSRLDDVVAAMDAEGAFDATRQRAEAYAERARRGLKPLPDSREKRALLELPDFVIGRTR